MFTYFPFFSLWLGRFPMGLCCCFFKVCFAMCSVMIQINIVLAALQISLYFHFCLTVDFFFLPQNRILVTFLTCWSAFRWTVWEVDLHHPSLEHPPRHHRLHPISLLWQSSAIVYLASVCTWTALIHLADWVIVWVSTCQPAFSVQWRCPWFWKKGRFLLLNWALGC